MKKSFIALMLAMTAVLGATSYAATADYSEETGKVTSSDAVGSVKTVLVTKDVATVTSDDIYYIDQASGTALDAAVGFAMKAAEEGDYKLILGYNGVGETANEPTVIPFTIKSLPADVKMTELDGAVSDNADGTFNKGFVVEGIKLGEYKWLVVTIDETTLGYPVEKLTTTVTGGADVNLGIQINNIDGDYKNAQITLGFTAKDNNAQ